MFDPQSEPRVFACAPGADFPKLLVNGLITRLSGMPPEDLARVEILVNTRRMQRRIVDIFVAGPATLIPKVRLITDLANDIIGYEIPPAASQLRRRLELSQLISKLLDTQPDLAPRASLFDLSDSLAMLLAEMQDEDVSMDAINQLDVTDKSGHWPRSQKFLSIVDQYIGESSSALPDEAERQRRVASKLIEYWQVIPPNHPIIIAGSTGSRGTTAMLMHAVARLKQGAVILPGFDFDLPKSVWDGLEDALTSEDHPQYRFSKLLKELNLSPDKITPWDNEVPVVSPERNRLISLALRPAPVTDQWMTEGPSFENVNRATDNMSLIEAPSNRVEAVAISLVMREAVEAGKSVALVTPDRMLTRRVTASLDRWGIEPDVSVGAPLTLSATGRLLLHVVEQFGRKLTAEALLILLKHPMVNSANDARGQHLLWTRELEKQLRHSGPPFPTPTDLKNWVSKDTGSPEKLIWVNWVIAQICGLSLVSGQSVTDHLALHISTAKALVDGHSGEVSDSLWDKQSGIKAQCVIDELAREAEYAGYLSPTDYVALFRSTLSRVEVRDPIRPHPNVMIWGTLEARVQGADVVILGGLNEGVWPEVPSPDPWLNRKMRLDAGLLLPERRVGLSAHDFQQAVGAKHVVLSRALRDSESETVASRWLNRLTNLLGGMSDEGRVALSHIKESGQKWLDLADTLDTPSQEIPAEKRPSPRPPVDARPRSLSVTAISRLIRDPYAIYAANVLRLRKMDPLRHQPDAPLRGTVLHSILEKFIAASSEVGTKSELMNIADAVLEKEAPWPASRILWRAKLERVADQFLTDERTRRLSAAPVALEAKGGLYFPDFDFTLTGTADRIDRAADGTVSIFDYKTGSPPSPKQLRYFDKQLLLEAIMAKAGAFPGIAAATVSEVGHIGIGAKPVFNRIYLESDDIDTIRAEFLELIGEYMTRDQGYTSRRAMAEWRFDGDYDQLARFGEWDETQEPIGEDVG